MSKRKSQAGSSGEGKSHKREHDDESSDEDMDMMDVEFEWFDPQPAVDFEGLKTLMRQLFGADFTLFDLSALSDLILSQPLLGSTVKVDGNESDPFAFLSVLNLRVHKDKPAIQKVIEYLLKASKSNPALQSTIQEVLSENSSGQVGLVLTERLLNCPAEITPPMYKMLLEEIEWALEEKEPYKFTHFLVLSKTYVEVASKLDQGDSRPAKKSRSDAKGETFFFHPEDEILQKHAIAYGGYDYLKKEDDGLSDSRRAFQDMGIKPQGHLILIEAAKFSAAVQAVEDFLKV